MLPAIPQIQESLASITLREMEETPKADEFLEVCEKTRRIHPDGTKMQDRNCIVLVQERGSPLSLRSLVSRIAGELKNAGHIHSGEKSEYRLFLAGKVLAMATAFGSTAGKHIDVLNAVIKAISPTRISQWAVLINSATGNDKYEFGDFSYGKIDLDTLRLRCERAGSNFFELHGNNYRNKRSIVRETRNAKTIEIKAIRPPEYPNTNNERYMYRIADEYYAIIAEAEKRRFLSDLDRQQAIYGAVGLGTIPAESLRRMAAMTSWIAVFEKDTRNNGWVVPNQTFFEVSSTEPKALSDGYDAINQALKLDDFNQRSLDESIQLFCHYIATAQDRERDEQIEEALLHLIFALDLLLGGKAGESLTIILAERVAILTHMALKKEIGEITEFIRECYDLRSGYVHRGEKGIQEGLITRLDKLTQVARAVLGAACYARRQSWAQVEEARAVWIKYIEVLRAKHAAGFAFDTDDLSTLGLNCIRVDPCRLVGVSVAFDK